MAQGLGWNKAIKCLGQEGMCDCKICMAYVHRFDLFNVDWLIWFSGTLSCRDSQSMLLILVEMHR